MPTLGFNKHSHTSSIYTLHTPPLKQRINSHMWFNSHQEKAKNGCRCVKWYNIKFSNFYTFRLDLQKIFEFLKNFPHPHTWDTLSQCMVLRERSLSTKTSPIAYILKPIFFFLKTPPTLTTQQHINTNTTQPPNRNININT